MMGCFYTDDISVQSDYSQRFGPVFVIRQEQEEHAVRNAVARGGVLPSVPRQLTHQRMDHGRWNHHWDGVFGLRHLLQKISHFNGHPHDAPAEIEDPPEEAVFDALATRQDGFIADAGVQSLQARAHAVRTCVMYGTATHLNLMHRYERGSTEDSM